MHLHLIRFILIQNWNRQILIHFRINATVNAPIATVKSLEGFPLKLNMLKVLHVVY